MHPLNPNPVEPFAAAEAPPTLTYIPLCEAVPLPSELPFPTPDPFKQELYESFTAPADPDPANDESEADPEPSPVAKKRNSTPEGRARSARNATKHGSCAATLILPGESEKGWRRLLARWCAQYQPTPDSVEYDFVLKVAQAEWKRLRCQRNLDMFFSATRGASPGTWSPEQFKEHDLLLRYNTAAERTFQREYRLLEQHFKSQRPKPAPPEAKKASPSAEPGAKPEQKPYYFTAKDATSPTGYVVVDEHPRRPGVTYPCPCPPPPKPPESAGKLDQPQ